MLSAFTGTSCEPRGASLDLCSRGPRVKQPRAELCNLRDPRVGGRRVDSYQQCAVDLETCAGSRHFAPIVLSRCNAVLELCQTVFRLTPQECRQLWVLFYVVLLWFANSRGQMQRLSTCSCTSCASALRSMGVRSTSQLDLGRDYLLHTLLPVARCTPSGCGHNLAVAQASTITPPAGAFPSMAFDVFGGRIVGQKLSDRHVNQAALRASYADLGTTLTRQHTSFSPNFTTLSIKHEVPGSSQSARGHRPLGLPSIRADAFRQEMRWVCGHFGVVICVDGWLQEARDISPQAAGTDVRNIVWRPSLLRDRLVRAFLFRQVFTKQLKCVVHVW